MPYFKQKILITIETLLSLVTNKIITVSNLNKKKMLDDNITSSEKIINIYSGINFKKFNFNMSKDLIRQKYLISDSKTIIGFIGRLSEQKNPKILVKAFVELLKQNNTIHLLLIGDGPLRLSIEMLIKKYNIEDNVTITGFINNVPEFLNVIDIYVQPSNWEGLGRALTEAMYMKKAIIATNVDGIPEIIKNNITGILIEPKKKSELINAILNLIKNENLRLKLGDQAYNMVKEKFSDLKMVEDIETLYFDLLKYDGK